MTITLHWWMVPATLFIVGLWAFYKPENHKYPVTLGPTDGEMVGFFCWVAACFMTIGHWL